MIPRHYIVCIFLMLGCWNLHVVAEPIFRELINLDENGTNHIFARTLNDEIWHFWRESDNKWFSESLRGTSKGTFSVINDGDLIQVYAAGPDGAVWTTSQITRRAKWNDWENLGGKGAIDVSAVSLANGSTTIIVHTQDHELYSAVQHKPGIQFSKWTRISELAMTRPIVLADYNGLLTIIFGGPESQVQEIRQLQFGGEFSTPVTIGRALLGLPSAVMLHKDQIVLVSRSTEQKLLITQRLNGRWTESERIADEYSFTNDPKIVVTKIGSATIMGQTNGKLMISAEEKFDGKFKHWSEVKVQIPPESVFLTAINEQIMLIPHNFLHNIITNWQSMTSLSIKRISPSKPILNRPFAIDYSFSNATNEYADGIFEAFWDNRNLDIKQPTFLPLYPFWTKDSTFFAVAKEAGQHTVRVTYTDIEDKDCVLRVTIHELGLGPVKNFCLPHFYAQDSWIVHVDDVIKDDDKDGILDEEETRLLKRFSPYYKFSTDDGEESFRPTDAIWYVKHSSLRAGGDETNDPVVLDNNTLRSNPSMLISDTTRFQEFGYSALNQIFPGVDSEPLNPHRTKYRLDVANDFRSGYFNGNGNTWEAIKQIGNVGLYGHVVPSWDPDLGRDLIKIEYWQFFGYSNAKIGYVDTDSADHEGDWVTIQVFYDPIDKEIVKVDYYPHGKKLTINFQKFQSIRTYNLPGEPHGIFEEYRYIKEPLAAGLSQLFDVEISESPMILYFTLYSDFETGNTHPVVYVEWGSHEFWPSQHLSFIGAPKHNGNSKHFYLTKVPPNLGEVEYPFSEAAHIIMSFNGLWGAFEENNTPPAGPALHRAWTWPVGTKISGHFVDTDLE